MVEYRSVDTIKVEHQGRRVTVRRKLPEGGYSDVVGIAEQVDAAMIKVRNRKGELIEIPRSDIHAARVIEAPANPR